MPQPVEFWAIWRFDPVAALLLLVAVGGYGRWLVVARARGHRWPWHRPVLFAAALALFAVLQDGIVGVYSDQLRWAFTLRLALLFFAVPTFAAFGGPVALLRLGGGERTVRVADAVLGSAPIRMLGNNIVAAIVPLAMFGYLLLPGSEAFRASSGWGVALTVAVPFVGFMLLAPTTEPDLHRTTMFLTAEFLLTFVELMIDATPALIMRVSPRVLDGATRVVHGAAWFPSPLRDQQLAGDLLIFIAEFADIPVLIGLVLRWQHADKRDAKAADALTDEEMQELSDAHLRRFASPDR